MHIDEIKAMAHAAHADKEVREELFRAVGEDDRDRAVHAAWALTHLPSSDNHEIAAHREALVGVAIGTTDISLRRITLTLLERLDWLADDKGEMYYVSRLDFCQSHMMLSDEPYGVRSLCMKLSYKISMPYPELREELRQSLLILEPAELGKGVRHTRDKLLKLLMP